MIKILINGYRGQLARSISNLLDSKQWRNKAQICAGCDIVPPAQNDVILFPTFPAIDQCDMPADVIIDCSRATGTSDVIKYAVKHKTPLLICTTGLSDDTMKQINDASTKIAIFRSPNMSIGVNLLASLISKAYKSLDSSGFDIEIVEKHHNKKLDAPSGTALYLADTINNAANGKFTYKYGRTPVERIERGEMELGIHSVRGGTITGEHSVIFAGLDEVIEIRHTAYTKSVFATGAINAALFLADKPVGFYTMNDMLAESDEE